MAKQHNAFAHLQIAIGMYDSTAVVVCFVPVGLAWLMGSVLCANLSCWRRAAAAEVVLFFVTEAVCFMLTLTTTWVSCCHRGSFIRLRDSVLCANTVSDSTTICHSHSCCLVLRVQPLHVSLTYKKTSNNLITNWNNKHGYCWHWSMSS